MWSTTPLKTWGLFHILSFVFMLGCVVGGVLLGVKFKDEKYSRKKDVAMTILGFVFVALEAFKIIFRLATEGVSETSLQLISFQICSIPMYLLPLMAFVKEGKVKDAIVGFVSFLSFTAAFFYFVKPAAALNAQYVVMSLHSILWHALMVGSGAFIMVAYGLFNKNGLMKLVCGYVCWIALAIVAVILDAIILKAHPTSGVDLFYIAQTGTFTYPLLSLFFKGGRSPYVVFVIAFLIYYGIGCFTMYGLGFGINKLVLKIKK